MPKQTFSDEVLAIWGQIEGRKKIGISSARTENLVDILKRELGLEPTLMRFGTEYKKWNVTEFLAARIPQQKDGWCQVYYTPQDCEAATGSKAGNWTQWASRLLDYGRASHPYAPKLRVPHDARDDMVRNKILKKNRWTFRFLTLEVVVFYLATQTQTWGNPGRILSVKDLIEEQDITTLSLSKPPVAEEIDMDSVFNADGHGECPVGTNGGGTPLMTPKVRVPKAGLNLVGYNPDEVQAAEAEVAGTVTTFREKTTSGVEVTSVDDILDADEAPAVALTVEALLDHLVDPEPELTDAQIAKQIAYLQSLQEQRKLERAKERLVAGASRGQFIEGEVCTDKPEWNIVRIRYPGGNVVAYTRQDSAVG